MATQYAASVTATQVGSYFVQQYYQVFQQQREYVHQFYNDASSMVRVDGVTSQSASEMVEIHQMITSLNFTGIEIKTINSLDSWNEGVIVVVSGSVKSRDFSGWRKFVQTFFLAPQEKGYFLLNDIFHLLDEEVPNQLPASAVLEQEHDYQPDISTHNPELPGSDYDLEEEASVYVNSVHIEGDEAVEEYSFQEHEEEQDPEAERVEEDTPLEESNPLLQSVATTVQESAPAVEEPVEEPQKLTYASILRASKGKAAPSVSSRPSFTQSTSPASDWNHASQPSLQQYPVTSVVLDSDVDAVEESSPQLEGESKSAYVRNLPPTVTSVDILQEFRTFGKIKHDGVFLRNRKDADVCYAFVEFEDVQSVQNAIKASPIQLAGKLVYIEERRPNNNSSTSRGRGRGRGGHFGGRTLGRGGDQNARDNSRSKINGFRGI
ncbi:Nuclear transport factor 2 (NTF2) family protein with RNA binding (RRM-RBD-RNP motif) domain [Forsythia ovata]|uniref:Nuclear transport factor 2 (NTF2) family protein with RNA binding (RRM-RBD-RNP motif) domain n=1 Tax=Forsythia ovata TaxID=205694 RepID=A0ABD1NX59_9LAMI